MVLEFKSNSLEESINFASKFAKYLNKKSVILLEGDLGAGKTVFAKGLGKGLNITETIISPTFNIVRCYFSGSLPLYHIDAYRLEDSNYDIGLDEYIDGDGISIIEWGEYIKDIIPPYYLKIEISIIDLNTRIYKVISNSKYYDEIIRGVENEI